MTEKRLAEHPALAARMDEVRAYLRRAADPNAVAAGLLRLLEAGADPLPRLDGWLRLIDASPVAVTAVAARPELAAEIGRERGRYDRAALERRLDAALAAETALDARLDLLRAARAEETLRIAWQDVVEGADLTVVTRRISDLAELLLERVLLHVQEDLAATYGRAWHEGEPVGVAMIALGKLGGAELNYSSDVDLLFVYGRDGETDGGRARRPISNREYFHRLVERVSREVNRVTARGRLYRLDLRLRPEGAAGSLARSLAGTIAYYRRRGETWERQAMLKARAIGGDRALGREFVEAARGWAYEGALDLEEIGGLQRIKQRAETELVTRGEERQEVKLGYGGIRDVEYVIQFLQLLHGAHDPAVRHHNSLAALRLLERAGAILPEERDRLDDAYRFLRGVEHRLQLVAHAQVHRIPDDVERRTALARRCGFRDVAAFDAAYRERAEAVRAIFDRLFRRAFASREPAQRSETELVLHPGGDLAALASVLESHGIRETEQGLRAVAELIREPSPWLAGSPRARHFFADLFPRLLDAIERTPDPDAALARIERITARVGARATLYEALLADERLLRLLVDLAGHSLYLANVLERSPGVLDQLVDAMATARGPGLASFEDIPTGAVPTAPDPARILSDYKNLELLRIGLRDIRGEQGVRGTGEDLTRLAEVVVRLAYERARRELRGAGADVVVVALGKLGARELLYGSDLDLVFFARDAASAGGAAAVARRLGALLETPTAHGKLYEVDFRLRPGGAGGELVATPAGFRDYFDRGLGETWERMAYTRARPVAGPPTMCEEVAGAIADTIYARGFSPRDAEAMAVMRGKLAAKGGPASLKRAGAGGVVDIEFVAQMHALRHGAEEPRYRRGNVLELLRELEDGAKMEPQRAADLRIAYRFLLSLESKTRLVTDLPEDRLPEDPADLRSLARRIGYVDVEGMRAEDSLREEYEYHRDVAARAFREAVTRTFA